MFDARIDARGYLLHRPIATAGIFWAKLLAGFVGYLACLLPPLILTAIYLQAKGIEQLPTAWQQLAPLMIATLIIFGLHPAAMWMAHRSARWIGTRWFPLVLGIAGVITACLIIQESEAMAFVLASPCWYCCTFCSPALPGTRLSTSRLYRLLRRGNRCHGPVRLDYCWRA